MVQPEALPQPPCVTLQRLYHLPVALFLIVKLPLLPETVVKSCFKVFKVQRNYNRETDKKQIIVAGR